MQGDEIHTQQLLGFKVLKGNSLLYITLRRHGGSSWVGCLKKGIFRSVNRHSYHIFVAFKGQVATMPSALWKKQEERGEARSDNSSITTTTTQQSIHP